MPKELTEMFAAATTMAELILIYFGRTQAILTHSFLPVSWGLIISSLIIAVFNIISSYFNSLILSSTHARSLTNPYRESRYDCHSVTALLSHFQPGAGF